MTPTCDFEFCGEPINMLTDYKYMSFGLEPISRDGAGGTNMARLQEHEQRFACARCVEKASRLFRKGAARVPADATCMYDGSPINTGTDYRQVAGWVRVERPTANGRSAGGMHAVRLPDRSSGNYACHACVERLAHGISVEQQTLDIA